MKKIPSKWAYRLAELHNLAMEIQEEFNDHYNEIAYDNDGIEGFDTEELTQEIIAIQDALDTIEADTSELDCEYNDYD